jgi:hypothetical protein
VGHGFFLCAAADQRVEMPGRFCLLYLSIIPWDRLRPAAPDALPFGGPWYLEVRQAIDFAKHQSRSHDAVINIYDNAGNVIQTHEHKGELEKSKSKPKTKGRLRASR